MRVRHHTALVTTATLFCCLALPAQDVLAKGGGGKGGGGRGAAHAGGGKAKHGGGGGRKTFSGGGGGKAHNTHSGGGGGKAHNTHSGGGGARQSLSGSGDKFKATDKTKFKSTDTTNLKGNKTDRAMWGGGDPSSSGLDDQGSHPWSMQRANEVRKRDHRLGVADQLDQLAERNGNENLHDTAERMREKAWDHYEKRLETINSKDPLFSDSEGDGLFDEDGGLLSDSPVTTPLSDSLIPSIPSDTPIPTLPSDSPVSTLPSDSPFPTSLDDTPLAERLTGRDNALFRQLRNEQRNLAKRMEAAQSLWDAYEQSGDELLADAARAVEERALAHFEKRMDAISAFQQRHGLTTPSGFESLMTGVPTVP